MSNLIFTTWFFKNQVQINRGSCCYRRLHSIPPKSCLFLFTLLVWNPQYSPDYLEHWYWKENKHYFHRFLDIWCFINSMHGKLAYKVLNLLFPHHHCITMLLIGKKTLVETPEIKKTQLIWWQSITSTLMPYPCSHFYFDIKFGNRLYSKEKRRVWTLLFWI